MDQVSMQEVGRAVARMAAVQAIHETLKEQAASLVEEARTADSAALSVHASAILTLAQEMDETVAAATTWAADLLARHLAVQA